MIGLDFGLGALEEDFWRVLFLMFRVGAALLAAPFFGAALVPFLARLTVTAAIAIFIAVWIPVAVPESALNLQLCLA
ncbi:MAG: flagellar biosynthetic protein FliR, partial [Sphingomonadaceae bacterium]